MGSSVRMLIVDDEAHVCASLEGWFLEEGYAVATAQSGLEGLEVAVEHQPQILLVDIKMPVMDGLTFQRRLLELLPDATVIIMTAFASVDTAVQALKEGAYDYILKPFDPEQLSHLVARAAARYQAMEEDHSLLDRLEAAAPQVIAAEGGAVSELLSRIERVAPTRRPVLLHGESGTGRRLLAQLIHAHSAQRFGPLVTVDCAASSAGSLGCELFGSQNSDEATRGERSRGAIELARKGTLFLRAIDRMPARIQVELVQALQENASESKPSSGAETPDFRLIAATERDLGNEVSVGRFRQDLLLMISVMGMHLPPLRDRPEDLPLLAAHLITLHAEGMERPARTLSPAALQKLAQHLWPGNVRELEKVLEGAVLACDGPEIGPDHLSFSLSPEDRDLSLKTVEGRHLKRVLLICDHDLERAAAEMGIPQEVLLEKMKQHGIDPP